MKAKMNTKKRELVGGLFLLLGIFGALCMDNEQIPLWGILLIFLGSVSVMISGMLMIDPKCFKNDELD